MDAPRDADDFERFWMHFVTSHRHPGTRWAHVAGLAAGVAGLAASAARRSPWPLALGALALAVVPVAGHRVFDGNLPENLGRPLYGARAFLRLCARTVTGRVADDLREASAAAAPHERGSP